MCPCFCIRVRCISGHVFAQRGTSGVPEKYVTIRQDEFKFSVSKLVNLNTTYFIIYKCIMRTFV